MSKSHCTSHPLTQLISVGGEMHPVSTVQGNILSTRSYTATGHNACTSKVVRRTCPQVVKIKNPWIHHKHCSPFTSRKDGVPFMDGPLDSAAQLNKKPLEGELIRESHPAARDSRITLRIGLTAEAAYTNSNQYNTYSSR